MKNIKRTILISMFIVGLNSTAVADNLKSKSGIFGAFTWTPNTDGGSIQGYKFDGSGMVGAIVGHKKLITDNLGAYLGVDMSYTKVDDTGTSNEALYSYSIINIGVTFMPINRLTLIGGVGHSTEYGEYSYYGTHYKTDEDVSQTNLNFGVMYDITDNVGLVVGYNTAPSALNYGFSVTF